HRREREDVSCLSALWLFYAATLVGAGAPGRVLAALGAARAVRVRVDALHAGVPMGTPGQLVVRRDRHRRSSVPGVTRHGNGRQHSRLYLEVAAVLDTDIPGRADGDPAG